MIDHDVIEERIVAYVLGGMDPIERAAFEGEFAEHRPDCERCTRLYADYSEVTSRLALAAPAVPPPPDLEDRIMALATGRHISAGARTPAPRWRRTVLGIAAVLVLVASSVGATLLVIRDQGTGGLQVARMESSVGTFTLAYVPGNHRAYLITAGVPQPPDGRVYQLWVREKGRMLPSAVFRPDEDRIIPIQLPSGDFDLVAVSEEPKGGSEQPTSDPLATATVD